MTRGWSIERRAAAVAFLLLAITAAVWSTQSIGKAERPLGNDLVSYLDSSRALYSGENPYKTGSHFPYIYPLFLAAALRPLAEPPLRLAVVLWLLLECACLAYILRAVSRHAIESGARYVLLVTGVVAVFGDVIQNELLNGQVNLLVLALMTAAVDRADEQPMIAPVLLGAAIAIKLTPAVLLIYWCGSGRIAQTALALLSAVALIASPWAIVQNDLWRLYAEYVREFVLARVSAPPDANAIFFTVSGFWSWMTSSEVSSVTNLLTAAAAIGAIVVWHRRVAQGGPVRAAWVYVAAMPLASPISEVHHLTALIPLFTQGILQAARRRGDTLWTSGAVLFSILLWAGRLNRTGPWYFLAVVTLVASAALAAIRSRVRP